jgi:hypothetical protein
MKNNRKKRKPGRRDREKARERKTDKEKVREASGEEEREGKKRSRRTLKEQRLG